MDMNMIIQYLGPILVVVTPMIVQGVKKIVAQFSAKIPKWAIPIVAAVIGAIGEALATGGTVTVLGPMAGAAATGVRDVVKFGRG